MLTGKGAPPSATGATAAGGEGEAATGEQEKNCAIAYGKLSPDSIKWISGEALF